MPTPPDDILLNKLAVGPRLVFAGALPPDWQSGKAVRKMRARRLQRRTWSLLFLRPLDTLKLWKPRLVAEENGQD